jgi:hypothetical protein
MTRTVRVALVGLGHVGRAFLELMTIKRTTCRGAGQYPRLGHRNMPAVEMVQQVDADVLLEASPVNLRTGQPVWTVRAWHWDAASPWY